MVVMNMVMVKPVMEHQERSPRITKFSWGSLEVEGCEGKLKDAKLFPGGSREWDWGESGTHHEPGIQPADIQELLDRGAEVVVLSMGHNGRLGVHPDTLRLLNDRGVEVHRLPTGEAVPLYNKLAEKEKVGALIHSTC
jgi:hypothetical protein